MSGYTCKQNAWNIDLQFLQSKIQESLNHGLDNDEKSICNHVRYLVNDVKKVTATYSKMSLLWTVEFATQDYLKQDYQYKFFIKS